MANELNIEQIKELLEKGSSEAQELLKDPAKITALLKDFEAKLTELPVAGTTIARVPLTVSMVKAYITKEYTAVSPKVIVTLVSAILYCVKKKDIIPDQTPVIGYVDDIGVIALALKMVDPELTAYASWREGQVK